MSEKKENKAVELTDEEMGAIAGGTAILIEDNPAGNPAGNGYRTHECYAIGITAAKFYANYSKKGENACDQYFCSVTSDAAWHTCASCTRCRPGIFSGQWQNLVEGLSSDPNACNSYLRLSR